MLKYVLMLACIWLASSTLAIPTEGQAHSEQLLTERINLQSLHNLVDQLWVLEPHDLAGASVIVAGEDDAQVFIEGDFIYVNFALLQGNSDEERQEYHIFKRHGTYQDHVSSELLGLEVTIIGSAELVQRQGDQMVLKITAADEPILIGYRLIPASWHIQLEKHMIPTEANTRVRGHIVAKVGPNNSMISVEDVVAINLGVREGLSRGDLVSVQKPGISKAFAGDLDAPLGQSRNNIGLIYVLQTFIKMSYGVVLKADAEIKTGYSLCAPTACDGKI